MRPQCGHLQKCRTASMEAIKIQTSCRNDPTKSKTSLDGAQKTREFSTTKAGANSSKRVVGHCPTKARALTPYRSQKAHSFSIQSPMDSRIFRREPVDPLSFLTGTRAHSIFLVKFRTPAGHSLNCRMKPTKKRVSRTPYKTSKGLPAFPTNARAV